MENQESKIYSDLIFNRSETMYSLENVGWKVKQIHNSNYNGKSDFTVTHRIYAPLGLTLQRMTIKEVVSHIENTFLIDVKFQEQISDGRRMYSFKHVYEQEAFAELWNGWPVAKKIDGLWFVLV